MPLGSKNGGTPPTNGNQERPVIFQKYFKSNNRTYAAQIKLSQIGKKYLVLTQGVRDPETDQLKKHTIFVFEQDLKDFFAMLQETVVYLRFQEPRQQSPASSPPSLQRRWYPPAVRSRPSRRPDPPLRPIARVAVASRKPQSSPHKGTAKPPVQVGKSAKTAYRQAATRSR